MFHQKVSPTSDDQFEIQTPSNSNPYNNDNPLDNHNHQQPHHHPNKVDYSQPPTLPPSPPPSPYPPTTPTPTPTHPQHQKTPTTNGRQEPAQSHTMTTDKQLEEADMKNSSTSLDDAPPTQPLLSNHQNDLLQSTPQHQQQQHQQQQQQPPTTTTSTPTPNNCTDSLLSPYHPPPNAPSSNTVFRKRVSPASNGLPGDHQQQNQYETLAMEPMSTPNQGSQGQGQDDNPNNMQLAKKDVEKHPEDEEIKENIDPDEESPKWDLLVYYAQNSTMHGIPSIVGSELYPGRHFFWIGVVCIMGVFLGTVIYWQMSDYYDYPTVTSVNIAYVGEDDFPAITVCDLNMFHGHFVESMKDNYTAYHLTKLTEITGFYHRYSRKFFAVIPEPAPGVNSSVWHIEQMMKIYNETISSPRSNPLYCSWGDFYWDLCPLQKSRVTELGMCVTIDVRTMVKEGKMPTAISKGKPDDKSKSADSEKMFGFEGSKNQKPQPAVGNAMRGLTLYLDTKAEEIPYRFYQYDGFKVILHNPDEDPLPKQNGFVVQGNTTVEVEISKQVKKGLPPPYKAFGSGTCVDTLGPSFQSPLKRFDKYTKQVCENECFINAVIETCGGCRHFLHPGNESLCEIKHLAECFRQAEADYYGGTNKSDHQCFCPMPCEDARYSASVTATAFKSSDMFIALQDKYRLRLTASVSYIHFYYADPVVTTIEQVPIYSTEGLLGNIGGQIGLFMGFSLITVAETLELIFLLATRGRRIDEHVKRQKSIRIAATATTKA